MGFPYALSQKRQLWHFSLPASILPRFVAVLVFRLITKLDEFLVKIKTICEKLLRFEHKPIDFSSKKNYNLGEIKIKRCI